MAFPRRARERETIDWLDEVVEIAIRALGPGRRRGSACGGGVVLLVGVAGAAAAVGFCADAADELRFVDESFRLSRKTNFHFGRHQPEWIAHEPLHGYRSKSRASQGIEI